jgi:hypothetical protein
MLHSALLLGAAFYYAHTTVQLSISLQTCGSWRLCNRLFTCNKRRWYLDLCSPTITTVDFKPVKPYTQYTDTDWEALRKKTACQYTSDAFRRAELTLLEKGAFAAQYAADWQCCSAMDVSVSCGGHGMAACPALAATSHVHAVQAGACVDGSQGSDLAEYPCSMHWHVVAPPVKYSPTMYRSCSGVHGTMGNEQLFLLSLNFQTLPSLSCYDRRRGSERLLGSKVMRKTSVWPVICCCSSQWRPWSQLP